MFSGSVSSSTSDGLPASYEQGADRILQLERELNAARNSIAEKEAKCMQLSELQDHVDSEVQELTEKLFQVFFWGVFWSAVLMIT